MSPPGGSCVLEARRVRVRDNGPCIACDHYRSIRSLLLVSLLLQCWYSDGRVNAVIELQDDGGYVGVVVAVHEALPAESELVEQLKSVLSRSSAFLHRATRGLVYFRDVTIALPPHWPPAEHGDALASLRANAPIRIVTSEQARWPRTMQPRPCGEAGEYTLLPVAALRDPQADYLVVHEWAHLRYGVFDEFGSPKDPLYPAVYMRGGQVDSFCNDSVEFAHNAGAPSPQNALCDGQSTWNVISATSDFRRISGPSPLQPTNFRVVRSGSRPGRLVLVMDVSASMAQGDRLAQLRRSVCRFLEDGAPDHSLELSMVVFSQKALILEPLAKLNDTVRRRLKEAALPVSVGGRTSMGAGITAALKALEPGGAEGSAVLLITDGEENEPPFLRDVLPLLLQKKVTLHTLAVKTDAQASLQKAARDTGGRAFTTVGSDDVVTEIADALSSVAVEQLDEKARPVTIFSESVNVTRFDVPLDEALGRATRFVSSSEHLEVVSPLGERFRGSYDASLKRSKLLLDSAWTGWWTVHLTEPARVSITSWPSRLGPVTQLRTFLGNCVLKRAASHLPPAVLHAELVRGARPLLGAYVTASVRTPGGREVHLLLRDDGAGIDVAAGDGVYSAAFFAFDVAGHYAVQMRARGRREARNGKWSFSRFADAGSLWVGAVDSDLAYAPATVRDLRVEGVRRTAQGWLVTLAWTASGDQQDQGTSARVELFVAKTASALRNVLEGSQKNKTSVHRVTESKLVAGSRLTPVPPAGHLHRVSIVNARPTSDHVHELYFAVVAVSHSGVPSALSNVAAASFVAGVKLRQTSFPPWLPVLLFSLVAVAATMVLAAAYLRVRRREVVRSDRPVAVFAAAPGKAQLEIACRRSLLGQP
ncbi:calcium-activated chloride channel regulator 2-like isoform X2 [Dermacentor variabilis]|uniref:calcium-activated chloride channel regulator 2-like isoform X2 n=1 Tax=Dermacentor variabilis TaxID=34621 RepID=UPI003F5C24A3